MEREITVNSKFIVDCSITTNAESYRFTYEEAHEETRKFLFFKWKKEIPTRYAQLQHFGYSPIYYTIDDIPLEKNEYIGSDGHVYMKPFVTVNINNNLLRRYFNSIEEAKQTYTDLQHSMQAYKIIMFGNEWR